MEATGGTERANRIWAFLLGGGAFVLWGVLPVYWKLLDGVPAYEIIANRILWSFVFMAALLGAGIGTRVFRREVRELCGNRKRLLCLAIGACLVSLNWFTYIWAVGDGRLVECSLGYYINPLVTVLIGVTVLRERLSLWQFVSVILAGAGVMNLTLHFGSPPWVALILAVSMALYSLCKKVAGLSAISGLTIETAFIAPLAAAFLLYLYAKGQGHPPGFDLTSALLILAGAVTAIPLLLFAHSLNHLPLTIVGFLQYMSPTITLALGIFLYGEEFTSTHKVAFAFIWAAIALFSLSRTAPLAAIESRLSRFLGRKTR